MNLCECGEKLVCACCVGIDKLSCKICATEMDKLVGWSILKCRVCNGTGEGDHCVECAKDEALRKKIKDAAELNEEIIPTAAYAVLPDSQITHGQDALKLNDKDFRLLRLAVEGR